MLKICVGIVVSLALWRNIRCEDICEQSTFELEEYFMCCKGKPTFTSENCIDALIQNNTLTQECVVDCMYKDIKIYDGVSMNLQAVQEFFEANVTDLDVRLMFVNAFEKCAKFDRKKLKQKFGLSEKSSEHGCDMFPAYMDECVWYHTVSHCPEKLRDLDDEGCNKKTHWVRECLF